MQVSLKSAQASLAAEGEMVDRAELEAIADTMAAAGEIPSIRKVRALLPGGGSHRVIGLLLADWRTARKFRPRPSREDLPPELLDALADTAARIWAEGHRQGLISRENERDLLLTRVDALEIVVAEISGRADALAERIARHEPEAVEATAQHESASRRSRRESIRIWAQVMLEIEGILAGGNWLTPAQIIRRLDVETLRRVPVLLGEANEARLSYKLEHRDRGRWFVKDKKGRFALRAEVEPIPVRADPEAPDGDATIQDGQVEAPA